MSFYSSTTNRAILTGSEDGAINVPTEDWQSHLSPYFRPLPGILGCHFLVSLVVA